MSVTSHFKERASQTTPKTLLKHYKNNEDAITWTIKMLSNDLIQTIFKMLPQNTSPVVLT